MALGWEAHSASLDANVSVLYSDAAVSPFAFILLLIDVFLVTYELVSEYNSRSIHELERGQSLILARPVKIVVSYITVTFLQQAW